MTAVLAECSTGGLADLYFTAQLNGWDEVMVDIEDTIQAAYHREAKPDAEQLRAWGENGKPREADQ